jgi:DNA-binding transcriptional MerR regulator
MTIAETAGKYGLIADTLRYYERIGLIPPVTKNKDGIRNYAEWDCNWVEFTKCKRQAGMPVEVLIEYISLFQKGDSTCQARKEILIEQRGFLAERIKAMQETLEKHDLKIADYDTTHFEYEKKLSQGKLEKTV